MCVCGQPNIRVYGTTPFWDVMIVAEHHCSITTVFMSYFSLQILGNNYGCRRSKLTNNSNGKHTHTKKKSKQKWKMVKIVNIPLWSLPWPMVVLMVRPDLVHYKGKQTSGEMKWLYKHTDISFEYQNLSIKHYLRMQVPGLKLIVYCLISS